MSNVMVSDCGGFELPLARHQLYSTNNPDVARTKLFETLSPYEMIPKVLLQCDTHSGNFRCTHNSVALQSVTISAMSYDAPVTLGHRDIEKFLFFDFVLKGECRVTSGENSFVAGTNDIFVINAGQPVQAAVCSDFQVVVVRVSIDALDSAILRMIDRPVSIPVQFQWCASPITGTGASLVRFVHLLCAEMDSEESASNLETISELYEQTLLSLILTSLPHNYSDWLRQGLPTAVPHYVYRAERFIRENLHSALTMEQIVSASGVSMRSLHQAFRNFRRMTPMLFLKECRLQYARVRLQNTSQRHCSVTKIAHDAGFEHSSKFSQAYKSRFGELPSATRSRSVTS